MLSEVALIWDQQTSFTRLLYSYSFRCGSSTAAPKDVLYRSNMILQNSILYRRGGPKFSVPLGTCVQITVVESQG